MLIVLKFRGKFEIILSSLLPQNSAVSNRSKQNSPLAWKSKESSVSPISRQTMTSSKKNYKEKLVRRKWVFFQFIFFHSKP